MPLISDESKSIPKGDRQIYLNLKKRLKLLICENENYQEELRKCQKELLIINRDKYFLMDKLMKYEKLSSSDSDSDVTDSSESEMEVKQERSTKSRRRRLEIVASQTTESTSTINHSSTTKRKRNNDNNGNSIAKIPPPTSSSSSSPSLITYSSYRNKKSTSSAKTKGLDKTTTLSVYPSTSLAPLKSTSSFSSSPTLSTKSTSKVSILSATLKAATIPVSLPTITATTVGINLSTLKTVLSSPLSNSSLPLTSTLNSSSSSLTSIPLSTSTSCSSHLNTFLTNSPASNPQKPLPPPSNSTSLSLSTSSITVIPTIMVQSVTTSASQSTTIIAHNISSTKSDVLFTCSALSRLAKETPPSILSLGRANRGQLTSEEIERHLESRPIQPSLLLPEKTPLTVPIELFSNESPNEATNSEIKLE